jgi:acetyl-CoA carboxylase biotin carboxyl carrier protein
MDKEEIEQWIDLFQRSNLSHLTVKKGDFEISMESKPLVQKSAPLPSLGMKEIGEIDLSNTITCPMVGTFYRSLDPKSPPFVEIGDFVKAGDTLCIIEAMKVMNEIKAERSGKIKEVMLKDGSAAEFAKPLFVME